MHYQYFLVLSRIKLSFTNTIIRLENILPDCVHGVGLELHIDRYVVLSLLLRKQHSDFLLLIVFQSIL